MRDIYKTNGIVVTNQNDDAMGIFSTVAVLNDVCRLSEFQAQQIQALQKENEELRKIARDLREYQDNESVDEIPMSIMDILCANKNAIDRLLTTEGEE